MLQREIGREISHGKRCMRLRDQDNGSNIEVRVENPTLKKVFDCLTKILNQIALSVSKELNRERIRARCIFLLTF